MSDRLYRSNREKMLGGVCSGIAEYFRVDVVLVRLLAVLAFFLGGVGVIAYLAAWIIMPVNPYESSYASYANGEGAEGRSSSQQPLSPSEAANRGKVIGGVLVIIGALFFLDEWFPWLSFSKMWPILLVLVGAGLIWRRER